MWIFIAIAGTVVALDLWSRTNASACDGCKRRFHDKWASLAFWQKRVHRSTEEYAAKVMKDGEQALCAGCVDSRRVSRQIENLKRRAEEFRAQLKNAHARVNGTIKAEAAKLSQLAKDLES